MPQPGHLVPSRNSAPITARPVTQVTGRTRAMATDVTITAVGPDASLLGDAVDNALAVFTDVEAQCTRFDARSPLMVANARCDSWMAVPARCFAAIEAAAAAYRRTEGRFDPRVHDDLHRLGYSESLAFESADGSVRSSRHSADRASHLAGVGTAIRSGRRRRSSRRISRRPRRDRQRPRGQVGRRNPEGARSRTSSSMPVVTATPQAIRRTATSG